MHPLRPQHDQPLNRFWRRRGYFPQEKLTTRETWKEPGQCVPSRKPLRFWMRTF